MGTDKQNSPLAPEAQKKQQFAQQQAQAPNKAQETDPERRQVGDKPDSEQVSAEKPDQRS